MWCRQPSSSTSVISAAATTMAENQFAPITPGAMLKEEFLAEYGLSQNQLAIPVEGAAGAAPIDATFRQPFD
jgi:hypothetical protein